jgi:Rieske Fe-S protein
MDDSRGVSRRHFITLASGMALPIAMVGCGRDKSAEGDKPAQGQNESQSGDSVTIQLADHPDLAEDGGFVALPAGGKAPAILLVRQGDAVRAFVNMCTHQACPLEPVREESLIYCDRNCGHGSIYSMSGELISGPSPRGLYEYQSRMTDSGQSVLISLVLKDG